MSQFGGSGNWWQGLQGLFGGSNQGQFGIDPSGTRSFAPARTATGVPIMNTELLSRSRPMTDPSSELGRRTIMRNPRPGESNVSYGGALAGALGKDYQNAERARQQELEMYRGLFGNIMQSMQGAGQMVQSARDAGQQNMQLMQGQADEMRRAAGEGQRAYDAATQQMQQSLGEARNFMGKGIATLQQSKADYDATNRSDTAGSVMGIQSQYKNQLDQIARRDDLTQEQKDMMTGELKQGMRQQSSALAAAADAKARDTLAAMDQNIAQMQAMAGSQLGQLGVGVGQAMGQFGMQSAAMKQQAESQIGEFYNNMAQFNSSLLQSAQANALQYTLNGNQLAANLVGAMPLGPMSVFETLTRMVSSIEARRGETVSPEMSNLFGRIG